MIKSNSFATSTTQVLNGTYFDTEKQWTTTLTSNQFIRIMPALKNKGIGSFKMPHDFQNNLTKWDSVTCSPNNIPFINIMSLNTVLWGKVT